MATIAKTREVERLGSLRYLPLVGEADQLSGFTALKGMYEAVMEIDQIIFRYAQALEAIQPGAPGKISIRFLRRQWGDTDSRHPQFIQWFQSASKKWLYKRLKPNEILRRLKSYNAFALTRQDARELLIQTRSLVELREKLFKDIGNTRRALAMHASKAKKAAEPFHRTIEDWLPLIEKRRIEIIADVIEAKEFAINEIPEDGVVDPNTMPRTHPRGRTRGTRTLSKPEK
jgi:hypothetical protein